MAVFRKIVNAGVSCVTCPTCSGEIPVQIALRLPREFSVKCPNCGWRREYQSAGLHDAKPGAESRREFPEFNLARRTQRRSRRRRIFSFSRKPGCINWCHGWCNRTLHRLRKSTRRLPAALCSANTAYRDEHFCSDGCCQGAHADGGMSGHGACPMSKTDQFWQYAKEAIVSASCAETDEDRQGLLELARTWTQAALLERASSVDRNGQVEGNIA